MKPGTYRIVNLKSGTAMTENDQGTVGWHKLDSHSQQWFVQQSGRGYHFKNVASGGYLTLSSTTDSNNRVYCSDYPTTWALVTNREHSGPGIYGIMMGDTDCILDLWDWGNKADGTPIRGNLRTRFIEHQYPTQHTVWKFEHISNKTGEESPSLAQVREALARTEQTVQAQAAEIDFLRKLALDNNARRGFSRERTPEGSTRPNNAT